ncbi:MAG: prolyl oligopeptidase family serine peptidase [Bacteroidaceae bacterium]|nr:prolyl oligopeptidase family serine peptidase [Bacteroidaceae bacterium]
MKKILFALLTLCLFVSAQALENIQVGNTTRTMIVYAPKGLSGQPALVIALHGANQDAAYLQGLAKWETVADTAKFVVVYANGVNKYWDISGTSDLQFMEAIIESMYSRYHINKNRVYLTGFSMGGMFTYYAATRMADKIAAFAPVSGYPMGGPNATSSRPVPILHTHGTADDVCVYSNVQSHIDAWVKFNGCNTTPEIIKPYPKSKPNSPASLKRYRNGKNGVEVALLTLADKGHWWSMDTSQALTSEEVWNFCKRYSLGAAEPEVESIVPENKSFDLLPERDNQFTVTFSEAIDCSKVSATLKGEAGNTIPLDVKSEGMLAKVLFALPTDAEVADGEYTLTISNAVNKEGGVMKAATFTYAYGVETVGETPNVDTLYISDWYGDRATIGEGIPVGWKRVNITSSGTKEVTAGGTANCTGVRLKYFEQGGDFDAGFYLSARDNSTCNLYYGQYSDSPLKLKVGKYRVSFNSVYWSEGALSANATYNFNVMTVTSSPVFSATSLLSTNTMSEKTDQKITGSKAYEYDFTISRAANYVLNFEMSEGWNSVIVGNILLTTKPTLADTYKGTFYRTLLATQNAIKGYEKTSAAKTLQKVITRYADLTSTSPSVYTAATAELKEAIAVFNESEKEISGKVSKSVNIEVNGEKRSYWLYVPSGCKPNAPLVIALHGAGGHSTDNSPRFNEIADKEGFIVAYPQGKDIYFPVFGGTVPGWDASGEDNADVDFIKAVIEDIADVYTIDRQRIYCCGFSNGGMMTYALANTCSQLFAAYASISGFPLNEFHLHHTGTRPVPFLHIHGKNDDFVKYSLMPVIVDEMVARNGANPVPVTKTVNGKYDKSVYEAMEGSFPYIYYEIDGMGHSDFTANTEVGSSSQTMWNFFKQYTLDTPCDTTLKWFPRLETEGYIPKSHGWNVNVSTVLLLFGREQNTTNNQNVYRSLQLTTGSYKLCFHSEADAEKTFSVKLQKLTGKRTTVLNTTLVAGGDFELPFSVEDGWGEYRLTFNRQSTSDVISITNLGIYSASDEPVTGILSTEQPVSDVMEAIYSPTGIRQSNLQPGLNIIRTADGTVKKILIRR